MANYEHFTLIMNLFYSHKKQAILMHKNENNIRNIVWVIILVISRNLNKSIHQILTKVNLSKTISFVSLKRNNKTQVLFVDGAYNKLIASPWRV